MNHIGRSFAIAFALIIGIIIMTNTPAGAVIQASLATVSASLLGR